MKKRQAVIGMFQIFFLGLGLSSIARNSDTVTQVLGEWGQWLSKYRVQDWCMQGLVHAENKENESNTLCSPERKKVCNWKEPNYTPVNKAR